MLIFMDESGDTGFKLGQGSSAYFVIMLVLLKEAAHAEAIREDIENLRGDLHWSKEFHFSKTPDNIRGAFLETTARHPLAFRAIVIPKGLICKEFLKTNGEVFYNYVTRLVLEHDGGVINAAKLFIDKKGNKQWRNALATYLRQSASAHGEHKLIAIQQKDWQENALVQLADMYSGALYRKVTQGDNRFYRRIQHKEQDVWYFR